MPHTSRPGTDSAPPQFNVAIIGAGFSGIGTAIALDKAGINDYVILEAGDGFGGVWHWNNYPGVAVDIPSFSYQFSFEQMPDWSRSYAPGRELKAYAEHCATKYGLRQRTRLRTRIDEIAWDTESSFWRIRCAEGQTLTARHVVNGSGPLNVPKLPDIPGLVSFAGETMHTARWDNTVSLAGKCIAVIGTGASAIQVIPEVAKIASHLTVFQRTPIWCLPKPDFRLAGALKFAMRVPGIKPVLRAASQAFVEFTFPLAAQYASTLPVLQSQGSALGKAWLRRQVHDPELRRKLTPDYALGCKRPSFHNSYLATYNRPNVHLETAAITKVSASGVHTSDGKLHEIDVLVLATGFKVFDNEGSFRVRGADGTLWSDFFTRNRAQSYLGVSLPNFPNYFSISGPYAYNLSSFFTLIEAQSHHIVRCLKEAQRRGAVRVEISEEANRRYFEDMMAKRHTQVFWRESCASARSYYFDANGDVPYRRASTPEIIWHSRRFPLSDYRFTAANIRSRRPKERIS
jgi:cation diffusion facilitator CzcD-associated flavoprotein CzcO